MEPLVEELADGEPTVEEFMGVVAGELAAAAGVAMALVGERLGLYRALGAAGPTTSSALASRAGCAERYVREWLASQVAGGWVLYDETVERFFLPAAHAAVIADEDSPAFLVGSLQSLGAMFRSLDRLCGAFRTGEGIAWGEHHSELHEGAARFFRTACHSALPGWVSQIPGSGARLADGGRIADLGCGYGGAALSMAAAFPQAEIVGVDLHEPSVQQARAKAEAAGVADRVGFRVAPAEELEADHYDLVTLLDALHDMGDPVAVATAARVALRPGGAVLIVEPAAGDRLADNTNPVSRMYYAASTAFCTPSALSQEGGWALGAQAGPARIRDVCARAGFSSVDVLEGTPFQLVLAARP